MIYVFCQAQKWGKKQVWAIGQAAMMIAVLASTFDLLYGRNAVWDIFSVFQFHFFTFQIFTYFFIRHFEERIFTLFDKYINLFIYKWTNLNFPLSYFFIRHLFFHKWFTYYFPRHLFFHKWFTYFFIRHLFSPYFFISVSLIFS